MEQEFMRMNMRKYNGLGKNIREQEEIGGRGRQWHGIGVHENEYEEKEWNRREWKQIYWLLERIYKKTQQIRGNGRTQEGTGVKIRKQEGIRGIKKGKILKSGLQLIGKNMREKERNRREQEGLLKQKDKKN